MEGWKDGRMEEEKREGWKSSESRIVADYTDGRGFFGFWCVDGFCEEGGVGNRVGFGHKLTVCATKR